jgi:hypothetical protein
MKKVLKMCLVNQLTFVCNYIVTGRITVMKALNMESAAFLWPALISPHEHTRTMMSKVTSLYPISTWRKKISFTK